MDLGDAAHLVRIQGRYRGDTGEIQGRYGAMLPTLLGSSEPTSVQLASSSAASGFLVRARVRG